MNDPAPPPTQAAVRRARRLAQLEAVLRDCAKLLDAAGQDCPEARAIEQRIERARREIDRLRGAGEIAPVRAEEQRDLLNQLAHWSGNIFDLADRPPASD